MNRREVWKQVLAAEVRRWSTLSFEALVAALQDIEIHTVERDSKEYQVEVQLLQKTDTRLQVLVSVDDGSLPASFVPASATFVVERSPKAASSGSA